MRADSPVQGRCRWTTWRDTGSCRWMRRAKPRSPTRLNHDPDGRRGVARPGGCPRRRQRNWASRCGPGNPS